MPVRSSLLLMPYSLREKDMRHKFTQQGSDVQGDNEDERVPGVPRGL